jgi:DNA-directed RNA polymerase specialized sigma24 family protein
MQEHDADRLTEFNRFRGLLFSIAYRMLGSVADAEDILQEAFIRWHGAPDVEIRSTRAFLVTVVSRLCINHLQSARENTSANGCRNRWLQNQTPIRLRFPEWMNLFRWHFSSCWNG